MRRVLILCVLVQVALACLAAKIYLTQHNTLHAYPDWTSTKTELARGLMGSFAFVTERQSLAGGSLNLGAWHGFQEVVYAKPLTIKSLAFDFKLSQGADLVAFFDRDPTGGASGVRFGTAPRHPSAFLQLAADGGFRGKRPITPRRLAPETWHQARFDFADAKLLVELDGSRIAEVEYSHSEGGTFGFRGGSQKPVLVDNVEVVLTSGERLSEDFDSPRSIAALAAAIAMLLIALNLALYLVLARRTGHDERKIAFALLTANLTVLVIGSVLFAFVLLRAGAYPGVNRALNQAEETFRRGTAEQVVADIRARHLPRGERDKPVYRVLFLGTSQTWGAGAATDDETFVARAEALLNASTEDGLEFECINAGFSSLRAKELLTILERDLLPLGPDLVVLNLATNDRPTRKGFGASIRKLALAAARSGASTVLLKEANEPGSMDRQQLARFAELDAVGAELDLPVIDMHGYLAGLQDTGFLWWDLVHLTSYGQRLLAERLVEVIQAQLAAQEPR